MNSSKTKTYENVDENVDKNVDKKVDENVDEKVDEKIDEKVDEKIDEKVDEKIDENIDENVDEMQLLATCDLKEMAKFLSADTKNRLRSIEDKEIFFVIGPTGAGKSTLICYQLGCQMNKEGRKTKYTAVPVIPQEMHAPVVKDSINSATFHPEAYLSREGIVYCDNPGFNDNRGPEAKLCTSLFIEHVVNRSKAIKGVIVVLEAETFNGPNRGETLTTTATLLGNFLKTDNENLQESLVFVITKYNEPDEQDKADILKNVKEQLDKIKIEENTVSSKISSLMRTLNKGTKLFMDKVNPWHNNSHKPLIEQFNMLRSRKKILELIANDTDNMILVDVFDKGESREKILNRLNSMKEFSKENFCFSHYDPIRVAFFDELSHDISLANALRLRYISASIKLSTDVAYLAEVDHNLHKYIQMIASGTMDDAAHEEALKQELNLLRQRLGGEIRDLEEKKTNSMKAKTLLESNNEPSEVPFWSASFIQKDLDRAFPVSETQRTCLFTYTRPTSWRNSFDAKWNNFGRLWHSVITKNKYLADLHKRLQEIALDTSPLPIAKLVPSADPDFRFVHDDQYSRDDDKGIYKQKCVWEGSNLWIKGNATVKIWVANRYLPETKRDIASLDCELNEINTEIAKLTAQCEKCEWGVSRTDTKKANRENIKLIKRKLELIQNELREEIRDLRDQIPQDKKLIEDREKRDQYFYNIFCFLETKSSYQQFMELYQQCQRIEEKKCLALMSISDTTPKYEIDSFKCIISKDWMVNPVTIVECGHSFEYFEIKKYFDELNAIHKQCICPVCSKPTIGFSSLVPNDSLRRAIEEYREKHKNFDKMVPLKTPQSAEEKKEAIKKLTKEIIELEEEAKKIADNIQQKKDALVLLEYDVKNESNHDQHPTNSKNDDVHSMNDDAHSMNDDAMYKSTISESTSNQDVNQQTQINLQTISDNHVNFSSQ